MWLWPQPAGGAGGSGEAKAAVTSLGLAGGAPMRALDIAGVMVALVRKRRWGVLVPLDTYQCISPSASDCWSLSQQTAGTLSSSCKQQAYKQAAGGTPPFSCWAGAVLHQNRLNWPCSQHNRSVHPELRKYPTAVSLLEQFQCNARAIGKFSCILIIDYSSRKLPPSPFPASPQQQMGRNSHEKLKPQLLLIEIQKLNIFNLKSVDKTK